MYRQLTGSWLWITRILGIVFSLFHIFAAGYGAMPDMQLRVVFILLGFALTLLLVPAAKRNTSGHRVPVWDILLICLVIASCINAYIRYEWYFLHISDSTALDLVFGTIIIVLAIETGRRVVGWALPALAGLLILYTFFGYLVPGLFYHRGFEFAHVMQVLYQGTQGIWGGITGTTASIIAIFIIFGSILLHTGGGQTFIDLAIKLTGRFRGGPALVAVLVSAMFGTVSGTATANVVTTGNFTIPLMKRLGYKPEFAGAVEAAASSGGIITPPIMGAGAFLMAEILQIPYVEVMKAAIIPAVLYYITIFSGVRFKALAMNLAAIPEDQIPRLRELLTWQRLSPLLLPVIVLLTFLLIGYTPETSAFWAVVTAVVLFLFSSFSVSQIRQRFKTLIEALSQAGIALIQIASLAACAGIVVCLISFTGIGVKFSGLIMDLAGTFLPLALVLAALVTIIIGMGMPAAATYLVAVSILGSALVMLGTTLLAAHMFTFYFSVFSAITPPVCVAAYAAGTIARANWLRIALIAMRLAILGYLIPFIVMYEPALMLIGRPSEVVVSVVTAALGAILLGGSIAGYITGKLNPLARVLVFVAGGLLLVPGWQTDMIAIAVVALAVLDNRLLGRLTGKGSQS